MPLTSKNSTGVLPTSASNQIPSTTSQSFIIGSEIGVNDIFEPLVKLEGKNLINIYFIKVYVIWCSIEKRIHYLIKRFIFIYEGPVWTMYHKSRFPFWLIMLFLAQLRYVPMTWGESLWFLLIFSQARYDGRLLRPMSAPVRRIISLMDNEEPVFGKTHQHFDPQLKDVYPHKGLRKTFHLFF